LRRGQNAGSGAPDLRNCPCPSGFHGASIILRLSGDRAISTSQPSPVEGLSFEAALKELESIVARLEQGAVDLEDSIALYERGQSLKSHCEAKLKAAEGRLEKIVMGPQGPQIGPAADAS
jgi:exodeoxyribonuclease VII small subunit